MVEKIIQQGAEAVLIKKGEMLLKRRVKKGYRIPEMDEKIRKLRTRSEAKLLEKAGKIVPVPKVFKVDEKAKEIDMEFIEGLKLSESLDDMKNWEEVCFAIGENIAKLHDAGIIHGDLTTSNMIWNSPQLNAAAAVDRGSLRSLKLLHHHPEPRGASVSKDAGGGGSKKAEGCESKNVECGKLYFIDFGLGFANGRVEDKAVDLYLIKEALEAKHFKRFEEYFAAVLEGYKASKNWNEVFDRLKKVEKRGRYKQNY
ncbi:MAG: Kae1-associated serine/threonine protein kinase [Nanoarchaeota archaeon]|nr:Kae1-associated serine/threonine protein kinase [Nanoarchaeota archaeon]MBU1104103.1 Kae1-associated serine/threonine protein kinase [Nanoarchaeota archaeon]